MTRRQVFPVIVGHGKRLFAGEDSKTAVKLAHCEPFSDGMVHLTYQPG